jgi:RNA polymerase sigma factor (sigma-70 family)
MNMTLVNTTAASDEQLWRLACNGDRDAFTRIVERYQTLVCSIAYSACGALGTSEDMAQETFITAWHRLKDLREPRKLRQWLCGIARNIAANALRQDSRHGGVPESLEVLAGEAAADGDPAAEAVTREEEALLWRTLADMPARYREPLILFYREEHSVAEVARQLDLTEDAVKQRLSRGRAMLREEMATLVESALARTRPGRAFTVGVLVALPMLSATTASAVAAAAVTTSSASTAGKGLLAKLGLGAFIGPVIGLACAYLGTRAAASGARSEPERACILRYARWITGFCFVMSIGLAAVLSVAGKLYTASAPWIVLGVGAWMTLLVVGIILVCQRLDRQVRRIRIETATTDEIYGEVLAARGKQLKLPRYIESGTRLLGLPLFAMAWGGANSDRYRPRTVCAWVAIGDTAISPFLAFGGIAVAPIALGALTVGVLSLSVFWGAAVGVFALGSIAVGWWALGCVSAGVKCAVGLAAVARDYAVGMVATGSHTGAVAAEWIKTRWFEDFSDLLLDHAHWWILGMVLVAVALNLWQRHRKTDAAPDSSGTAR